MQRLAVMNTPYELHFPPALADRAELTKEVQDQVKAADWQTFIVAMTVLVGGGFLLVSTAAQSDVRLAAAGFIGAVVSYFFGAKISTTSAAATIAASQQGASQSANGTAADLAAVKTGVQANADSIASLQSGGKP